MIEFERLKQRLDRQPFRSALDLGESLFCHLDSALSVNRGSHPPVLRIVEVRRLDRELGQRQKIPSWIFPRHLYRRLYPLVRHPFAEKVAHRIGEDVMERGIGAAWNVGVARSHQPRRMKHWNKFILEPLVCYVSGVTVRTIMETSRYRVERKLRPLYGCAHLFVHRRVALESLSYQIPHL